MLLLEGVLIIVQHRKNTDPKQIVAHNMTHTQLDSYLYLYKMDCKKFNYKLNKTENTDKAIAVINYLAWDKNGYNSDDLQEQLKIQKALGAYGFTSQNRITSDWVLNNPYEAYKLTTEAPTYWFGHIAADTAELYDNCILGKGKEKVAFGMGADQITSYMEFYGILSNGQKFNQLKSFENLKFEATEDTKSIMEKVQHQVWDDDKITGETSQDQIEARKLLRNYGFSKYNKMPIEWVVSHPYGAYCISQEFPDDIYNNIINDLQ